MKNKLTHLFHLVVCFIGLTALNAQTPVLKVDLNYAERNESEVHEPDYLSWILKGTRTKTFEGITFSFINGASPGSWYKGGVQAPYYARLVNDGIKTDDLELTIIGLKAGHHSLVTFHNNFDNPESVTFGPMDVYLNGNLEYNDVELTTRALSNDKATTVYLEFETQESDTIRIRFKSDPPNEATSNVITICGFHLNSSDPKNMARTEYPLNKDEHVNIDNDTLQFKWLAPVAAKSFHFYFGTNENDVLLANTESTQFLGTISDTFLVKKGFYSMDNYYWRVDPIDSNGLSTKGDVWYFKKRLHAFPGAEGYGGYAIGGRGGKTVYVTNLNDNGPGSFRDAVENDSGPRTILFNVSGIITLHSRLVIRDDYITVAGQTAPGKGVCFRWAPIGVTGDNLIVQNIRVRLGIGVTSDGMGLTGSQYSIIDHCSISWTIDEAFSSRGAKNITLQRTLISEALNAAGHKNYGYGSEHGYAGSIGGDIGSFHHNLLAHCYGRNWSMAGGLDGDNYYAGRLDLFNNIVYNWGSRATDGGAHEVNFVGNYYKKGKSTKQNTILKAQLEGTGKGSQSYYCTNNMVENTNGTWLCDGSNPDCYRTYTISNGQQLTWDVFVDEPFFPSEATIHSATDAYKIVLSDVGCTQPVFDDHDIRMIDETLNGSYSLSGSFTGKAGFPDHEKDAGYWEVYPGFTRSQHWDTDMDGLPNWWENAHNLNANSPSLDFTEANADKDLDGYTNLEDYLQWMSRPHYFIGLNDSLSINLALYTKGFTNDPTYSLDAISNGNATLVQAQSVVKFKPSSEGMAELSFTVTDAEGTSMSQKIGVFIGELPADSMFAYTYYLDRDQTQLVTVDSVNTISDVVIDNITHQTNLMESIHVYPNPTDNRLTLQFNAYEKINTSIAVYDVLGKLVLLKEVRTQTGKNTIDLPTHALSSGLYFLKINAISKTETIRFIKN